MKKATKKLISVLLCALLCLSTLVLCASAQTETVQVICSRDNALQHGWYRVVFYAHDTYEVRPNPDDAYSPLVTFGVPGGTFTPYEGTLSLEAGEYLQIDFFPEHGYRLAYLNALYISDDATGSTPPKGTLEVVADYSYGNTYVLATPTGIGDYTVRIDPVFYAIESDDFGTTTTRPTTEPTSDDDAALAAAKADLESAISEAKAYYDTIKDTSAYAQIADDLDTAIQRAEGMLNSDVLADVTGVLEQLENTLVSAKDQKATVDAGGTSETADKKSGAQDLLAKLFTWLIELFNMFIRWITNQ